MMTVLMHLHEEAGVDIKGKWDRVAPDSFPYATLNIKSVDKEITIFINDAKTLDKLAKEIEKLRKEKPDA